MNSCNKISFGEIEKPLSRASCPFLRSRCYLDLASKDFAPAMVFLMDIFHADSCLWGNDGGSATVTNVGDSNPMDKNFKFLL